MDKLELKNLFEAIKKDDVKSFSSIMLSNSDLNICFGRFPILSLLFMYGSYKIIEKYERLLLPIHNYKFEYEYFEIYKTFKRYSKKSLRLFVGENKIVYPIEMLAILDERHLINKYYKLIYKNEEILNNLQKIYILNKNITIKTDDNKIELPPKKLSLKQKILSSICMVVAVLFIGANFGSVAFVSDKFGVGTAKNPIQISTETELQSAIKNGSKYYVLTNDISLSKNWTPYNFKGTLFGNNYSINAGEFLNKGFVLNLTGSLFNLTINTELKNAKITENYGIIAEKSSGKVDNCAVNAEVSVEAEPLTDCYFSAFVVQNDGEILNSISNVSVSILNKSSTNVFCSAFAGINNGTIENCKTLSSEFVGDTVDIAGIVGTNYGDVLNCENNTKINQTSSKEWHPNSAGICLTNYGEISDCKNKAEVFAESTVADGTDFVVIAGGVACLNYGLISNCRNTGKVVAKGDVSTIYCGGVVAQTVASENNRAEVKRSKCEADVVAYSKKGQVIIGGVAGFNTSVIDNCGYVGNINANTDASANEVYVYAGGVAGINSYYLSATNYGSVKNSYANVSYAKLADDENKNIYMLSAVIGYAGVVQQQGYNTYAFYYCTNNHFVVNDTFDGCVYGTIAYMFTSTHVIISSDTEVFVAHEKLENISSEVLIND